MQYDSEEYIEILNIFKAESEEIIQDLNDGFLELEKNPDNKEPIKKLFQLSHSLKGAARMLGFNSVQDISHKLEDVLSYWKKEEVYIDKDSFQLIYDVCDFLNEIISKSVRQMSDYSDKQVMIFLNKLDNFITSNKMIPAEKIETKSNIIIAKRSTDINAILLELMFVLERDDDTDSIDEILLVIADNLTKLTELFQDTDFENIKNHIKSIFQCINVEDTDKDKILLTCRDNIIALRNEIYSIYKDYDIPQYLNKHHDNVDINAQTKTEVKNEKTLIQEYFDELLKKLPKIKYERLYINEINDLLEKIIILSGNKQIEVILSKTINLLKLIQSKNKTINNDCYMVILQCVYFARNMSTLEDECNLNNLNFLTQRLNVVEDMLNITDLKGIKITDELNIQPSGIENEIETIRKNLNSIDLHEIKTLRVDTSKLDSLISQIGELLVSGIKNREHLIALDRINSRLLQWHSESKKVMNYLKYFEKKGFFSYSHEDNISAFYKKVQSFFWNNANVITDINNEFDRLYNIISEDDNKLHQTAVEIETIAKGIRVLPLAAIFHSFPRMIRDIAIENNKKIDFIVSGSDTTVDKKLIEEIKIPLIHILRNSVSHGIEEPQERLLNGKKETGVIKLTAKQIENNVLISIEDDGYGINLQKVKQTAIKKGILTEEEVMDMTNEQLMKLLFLPGFSTEESINEISGRGIGLDVVKTKINNLNGDIFIDSVLNKGCKVTIKIPLSMSTLKTFILMVNEQKYAIPVSFIKLVKHIRKDDIFDRNGQNFIIYDNHSIPLYFLSEIFGEKPIFNSNTEHLTVIIIENQEKQAAFVTEKLFGSQEVVHKKLMPPVIKIKNISGFTTLSTGELCLIINPYELIYNTVIRNYIPSIDFKYLTEVNESVSNKKIVIYEDEKEFIKKDLAEEFSNIVVFNNLYSVYDYIKRNETDLLICKLDKEDKDIQKLLYYIKSDENLSLIKVIIVLSDTSIINTETIRNNYKNDLCVKYSEELNLPECVKSIIS